MRFDANDFSIPEELCERIKILIPKPPVNPKGGRAFSANIKLMVKGIFYRLKTGCQWKNIPRRYGAPSAMHEYFTRWTNAGVFETATTGTKKTGKCQTNRGKLGTKRVELCSEDGIPLSIVLHGANVHGNQTVEIAFLKKNGKKPLKYQCVITGKQCMSTKGITEKR